MQEIWRQHNHKGKQPSGSKSFAVVCLVILSFFLLIYLIICHLGKRVCYQHGNGKASSLYRRVSDTGYCYLFVVVAIVTVVIYGIVVLLIYGVSTR